jgi:hypothetical protein
VYQNISYQSNIGIIGDNVGAGKSLSALAIIAAEPKRDKYHFPQQYFQEGGLGLILYENKLDYPILQSNLIVVPHSVINQWEKYIKDQTSLTYLKINSMKTTIVSVDSLNNVDILLVSNNFLHHLYDQCLLILERPRKFYFQRVFIDEADNIKLSHGAAPLGLFNWFITSSVENLLFPDGRYSALKDGTDEISYNNVEQVSNKGLHYKNYIRNLFSTLTRTNTPNMPIFDKICLKNRDEYIETSFQLPVPIVRMYHCKTPYSIKLLANMTNKAELQSYINANNIEALKEKLGFKVETTVSIGDMLTVKLKKNLHNEERALDYTMNLEIGENERNERLDKIKKRIEELKSSIDYVLERMKGDAMCPICHDTVSSPICSVICCGQLYCLGCLTEYFNHKKVGECPCCRAQVGFEGIHIVDEKYAGVGKTVERPRKEDLFSQLVCSNIEASHTKRWLVFSNYDETFNTLVERLNHSSIPWNKISGTVAHIDNVIKDFWDGKVLVLFLNAVHFGMGLNLEMATDVLIYHQLGTELERQVIGRAQRPGRSLSLNIHFLCHDNELDGYKERFQQGTIL